MREKLTKEELIAKALELGAVDAVPFVREDIVYDPRTLLKCMYGCDDWGKGHTCPSEHPEVTLEMYREMLKRYSWGIIVHAHDKHTNQQVSLELERLAFESGYYFAFSMSDCGLCARCAGHDGAPCRFPKKARPAFHSVGIDVFATVRRLGLPIYTLTDPGQEEQNWYAAVFVE